MFLYFFTDKTSILCSCKHFLILIIYQNYSIINIEKESNYFTYELIFEEYIQVEFVSIYCILGSHLILKLQIISTFLKNITLASLIASSELIISELDESIYKMHTSIIFIQFDSKPKNSIALLRLKSFSFTSLR